ncbi:MAG: L-threonylcarbamoyladenylate synthase, partial [Saprospiraceae bacterium]
ISPTRPEHVADYFQDNLAVVLDGGACKNGIESTIIGFEKEEPVLYRLGSISLEALNKVVGPIIIKNKKEVAPNAPGMLARHYAPNTSTYLVDDVESFIKDFPEQKIGVLQFQNVLIAPNVVISKVLSPQGDFKEAAAKLYASLHQLDRLALDMIVAERFPDRDLGKSINDRLTRATKKK